MTNKYIKATYKLYDVTDGNTELLEETRKDMPFVFISGMGVALDEYERQLNEKQSGEEYDIALSPEQAYGEHVEARVIEVEVMNPDFDIKLNKDMNVGDRIKISSDRLRELEEAGKKNKIQLVKVVKIVKKEG